MRNHYDKNDKKTCEVVCIYVNTADLEAANGEEDIGRRRWEFESSAEHGFQVCLVACLSKTGHLTCTGHLHSCSRGENGGEVIHT